MKELLEQRAKVFEQARAIVLKAETEKRALTGEEQTEYDARMADVKALGETIDRSRKSAEVEAELSRSIGPRQGTEQRTAPGSDMVEAAMDTFLRSGVGNLSAEQRSVFAPTPGYRDGIQLRATAPLSANYSTGQALGAATIPQGFVSSLDTALKAFSGMRQCATIIRTSSGQPLPWPTTNDTGNEGAIVAENTQIVQSDPEMAFSSVTFGAYKYNSKLVLVPIELLQDSAFDVQSFVATALGTRLGRIQNKHFTNGLGSGSSQPKGLIVAATSGLTTALNTTVSYDELVDLEHSVDPAYRVGANWCFNDATAAFLEKLKDNNGRPLLNDSFSSIAATNKGGEVGSMRYTLKGYPVCICTAMDSIAATKKPIAFGDCTKYIIRDVLDLMLVRFSEKYMDYGQIGFTAFMRTDANLVDAGTNPVKFITVKT
jgi:HK97 family phage major capsid protein